MSVDCVPFNPASALPAEPPMFSFKPQSVSMLCFYRVFIHSFIQKPILAPKFNKLYIFIFVMLRRSHIA